MAKCGEVGNIVAPGPNVISNLKFEISNLGPKTPDLTSTHQNLTPHPPLVRGEVLDAFFSQSHALAFEQFALQPCVWLADQQSSAGTYYAMPGDSAPAGAGGHGASGAACAARQSHHLGNLAVGRHAAAGDFFHQPIYRIPIH